MDALSVADPELADAKFVREMVGFNQLVETPVSSIGEIVARLNRFSSRQVVETISRISLTLTTFENDRFWMGQLKILLQLFGPERYKRLVKRLSAQRQGARDSLIVLFHERQTLNLLKVAFLVLDDEPQSDDLSLDGIGEALLMLNDVLDSEIDGLDPSIEADRERLELYWFANSSFNRGGNPFADFARTHELFIRQHQELTDFIDLNRMLEDGTGEGAANTWYALWALHGSYFVLTPDEIDQHAGVIDASRFFSSEYGFSEADSRRLVGLVTRDVTDFQAAIRDAYSLENLRPFDLLTFVRSPVVSFDAVSFCVSLPLLRDAAGLNFQHRFIDPERFPDEGVRRAFLDYRGSLFGSYVENLLLRAFPGGRVLGSKLLEKRAAGGKSCDAIVLYADAIILFEIKAAMITLSARSAQSFDAYLDLLKKSGIKGAEQISKTIDLIQTGACSDLGADPAIVRTFFPVVVTLEMILNHAIQRRLRDECTSRDFLQQKGCQPLQLMDISDLELIENAVGAGTSLRDLLADKVSDPEAVGIPFKNYCFSKGFSWSRSRNPNLETISNQASADLLEWLRARKV